ncbi:hypothetical protein GCM10027589_00270 [Actinocorallia lasiicapitis]
MPAYVDVGVVRIQSYIARTPDLRLRRGASWLLKNETSRTALASWLPDGVTIHEEAGDVDGVVHLMVPEHHEAEIATRLLLHLRTRLPGADLQAMWASAASYPDARPKMIDRIDAFPPLPDFPPATTCEACRVDVRVYERRCADCQARELAGGRRNTGDQDDDALGTERDLLEELRSLTGGHLRTAKEFKELAALGGRGNHLATIAFDGNGLGAFFDALDASQKRTISAAISAATWNALVNSAGSVIDTGDQIVPVVPHVLGGDDLVVSVVADRAWRFVRRFLAEFEVQVAGLAPDGVAAPTMSAGVVFAHHKFPYARAVHIAEQTLRKAKHDTSGAHAAVAWTDVTEDGEASPAWRQAITIDRLDRYREVLTQLTAIPNSGRQELARHLSLPGRQEAEALSRVWARRNGHPIVRSVLDELNVTETRNLVSITRWWRA